MLHMYLNRLMYFTLWEFIAFTSTKVFDVMFYNICMENSENDLRKTDIKVDEISDTEVTERS